MRIDALTAGQVRAWQRCAAGALVANPFFEPGCQLPAVRELDYSRDAHLVVASRGDDEVTACVPVHVTRGRYGALRRRIGHSRPFDTTVGLGSPLVLAGAPAEALESLLDSMRNWSRAGGPGLFVLDWLDYDDGGVGRSLEQACARRGVPFHVHASWQRPVLRAGAGPLSLRPGLSKERYRQLMRRRRRLAEALGPVSVVDRAGDGDALDTFVRLEASGWKGQRGGAYARRPDAERWFRSLCSTFAAENRLHLLSLEAGGRTVAMQCALRSGSSVFFFRVGHDAELGSFAPGVLLQLEAVEHLGGDGVRFVDTCADPGSSLPAELFPERRMLVTALVAPGGLVDRTALRAFSAWQRSRRPPAEVGPRPGPGRA